MLEDWTIYSWYCPNCKTQVAGLKNKKNQIRVICTKCSAEMVRTVVGRRHDVIDIYAPIGMEHKPECNYVIWVGNRRMIKRKKFDEYLESAYSV